MVIFKLKVITNVRQIQIQVLLQIWVLWVWLLRDKIRVQHIFSQQGGFLKQNEIYHLKLILTQAKNKIQNISIIMSSKIRKKLISFLQIQNGSIFRSEISLLHKDIIQCVQNDISRCLLNIWQRKSKNNSGMRISLYNTTNIRMIMILKQNMRNFTDC